jgi:DNA-binding response OmpR family regulator
MHQMLRPDLARILAVSQCGRFQPTLSALLNSATTYVGYSCTSSSVSDSDSWDVIVFDRQILANGVRDLLRVRQRCRLATIIVVSALGERDVEMLIDAGADDAIVLADPTLAARLNAAARRARTGRGSRYWLVGDLLLDALSGSVTCSGSAQSLTRIEAALVRALAESFPQPAAASTLIAAAWGVPYSPGYHETLRVYIGYLRSKLSLSTSVSIATHRGRGYAFAPKNVMSSR